MAVASSHARQGRKHSILVVGNATQEMRSVALLLRRFAYDVSESFSAGEAVEKISSAAPELVITDVVLPGMSGLDLFHALKQVRRTASIPVAFVIPLTDAASESRCLGLGAAGCITKPVQAEELFRVTQAILEPIQRCDIRIDTRIPVSVNNVPLGCADGECVIELSERGMYLPMDKPYPKNNKVTIQFNIRDRSISAEGSVVYSHASDVVPHRASGMGLKFIDIKPGDREFIRRFVHDEVMRDIGSPLTHEPFDPWQQS